ncbi:EthD domain-containing protein [Actinomadura sp. KC216]|uniref:EthD domain-containing protein n=1 Tax=Actinomadura sp. KC216 TaxID=2530370 RepID=UPI00140430BE|nr:EthD domain-containing protein [Actinomadura sp. KC216]
MPVEVFRDRWATVHAEKVSRLPGIQRYVQNMPLESVYSRGREPQFDAVAEFWFEDDHLDGLTATPGYAAMEADALALADPPSMACLRIDEIPLIDGPRTPLKLIMFVRRRADLSVSRFQDHWRDVHGPIAVRNSYIRRYVQAHVRERAAGEPPAEFDGVGMVWFDTPADMRASGTTPEAAEASEDGARFAEGGVPSVVLPTSETVVVA